MYRGHWVGVACTAEQKTELSFNFKGGKMRYLVQYSLLAGIFLIAVSCGPFAGSPPTPVATIMPTATPLLTATPLPTATVTADRRTIVTAAPTATPEVTATTALTAPPVSQKDIIDTASELGTVAIFLQVMEASGLAAQLREVGPFTVFIPTDNAFELIPQFIRDRVLSNPDANASQALLALVAPGKLTAAMLTDGLVVQPLQGTPLQFARAADGSITVNGVKLITVDIEAANGVIHLIDGLILPDDVPFGR